MKKWYQCCHWMLLASLALNLGGCAQTPTWLSRSSSQQKEEKKLADVDGKDKKKNASNKKADPVKAKAGESQLAKKPATKPKSSTTTDDATAVASAKDATKSPAKDATKAVAKDSTKPKPKTSGRESLDPFDSPEMAEFAPKKATTKKPEDSSDEDVMTLADTGTDAAKASKTKAKQTTKPTDDIQKVAHEDDLPEWVTDGASGQKAVSPAGAREKAKASDEIADAGEKPDTEIFKKPFADVDSPDESNARKDSDAPKKSTLRTAKKMADDVSLVDLCPKATGEVLELIKGLDTKDVEGLKRGIPRFGRMGVTAQPAAPALIHLLKHEDGYVRTHAALALARMQASPPEAVQTVVEGLKSTDSGIRSFAAAVLAEMGPQATDALSTLAESLDDQDGYVRLHAAEVLIRYEKWSYQALETLLDGLKDKDENIRWLATYSLAELAPESPETVEALLRATRDRVLKVQIGAVYALGEIGPFAKSASPELRKLVDSTPHAELHSAILYALQQIEQ